MDRPCAVSPSWPEQTGHPRLAVLTSAKGVGGGPSATMTIKANAPSDECPNLPAVRCSNPQQVVPGTLMTFPGLKNSQQRADVIAYLETLR